VEEEGLGFLHGREDSSVALLVAPEDHLEIVFHLQIEDGVHEETLEVGEVAMHLVLVRVEEGDIDHDKITRTDFLI